MRLGTLPNPNSGTDAVTLKDGRHLLIYNHTRRSGRHARSTSRRRKDGTTWQAALVLEERARRIQLSRHHPDRDGLVHITYTWKRQKVKHVVVDPAKLTLKPIVDGQWPR